VDGDEDAEDAMDKVAQQAKALQDSILRKRHTVIQRHLPRPQVINFDMGALEDEGNHNDHTVTEEELGDVRELLREEMLQMLKYDAFTYPVNGEEEDKKKKNKNAVMPKLALLEEADLLSARELITDEMSAMGRPFVTKSKKNKGSDSDSDASDSDDDDKPFVPKTILTQTWNNANVDVAFLPFKKLYGSTRSITDPQKVQVLRQEFALMREQLLTDNKRAGKLEEKLNILTGGYRARAAKLRSTHADSHKTLEQCLQEKGCFNLLLDLETKAIPQRMAILERESAIVSKREIELQSKYAVLKKEKQLLQARLAKETAAAN
jgi:hypothetical protein